MDWKHIVAVSVGLVLGIVGAAFKIDFSASCPAASVGAPSAAEAPTVTK